MLIFLTLLSICSASGSNHYCLNKLWYYFHDYSTFIKSPWAQYIKLVYGEIPGPDDWYLDGKSEQKSKDLCVGGRFHQIFDAEAARAGVSIAHGRPTPDSMPSLAKSAPHGMGCPSSKNLPGERYTKNNIYGPPGLSYVYQSPSKLALRQIPSSSWVEVSHLQDPFGDEQQGMWLLAIKGSGIWFNVGVTIAFNDHGDAYAHFGIPNSTNANQRMSIAASREGYDSVQFLKHIDPVQYPCDTQHTGVKGRQFLGLEIVAVKHAGTYPCGTHSGASTHFRIGWTPSRPCRCNNSFAWLNCDGVPKGQAASADTGVVLV